MESGVGNKQSTLALDLGGRKLGVCTMEEIRAEREDRIMVNEEE